VKKLLELNKNKPDYWLFGAVVMLVAFGCLMVYSASYYDAMVNHGDKWLFARRQILSAVIGLVAMCAISFIDFNKLKKLWLAAYLVGFFLLVLVLVPGIGMEVLGARRWLNLPGFTIQPSEIAKFSFVLFAAWYMARSTKKNKNLLDMAWVFVAVLIYAALIMFQPNFSTTMVLLMVMGVLIFVGGLDLKQYLLLAFPAIAGFIALMVAEPYRMRRLTAFINPWENPLEEGFQLIQSLYSLASGGFFGVGLFQSRQKLLFLPFSESDFIFSIIGEELGFFGAGLTVLAFMFILWRGIRISMRAENRFGCYLAVGISLTICIQAMVNIAVVSGAIPPTGLPLPFISAGGTSLIVFMSAVGVLLNISRKKTNYALHNKNI